MAKVNGIVNIEGTVDNYTFFKKDGKNFVRRKGGVSKERISSDPNFVRTRENNTEFGHSGSAGKIFRGALGSLVFRAKDSRLSNRLLQTMSKIKNLDSHSTRGNRRVGIGLTTAEGKQHLKGFNFNIYAPLNGVLYVPFTFDSVTGTFDISNFLSAQDLLYPEGATHVSFQSAVLGIDFETDVTELAYSSAIVNLPIDMTLSTVNLTFASVPTTTGVLVYLLLISFYQEINGVQYALKNEEYNSLSVLDVV